MNIAKGKWNPFGGAHASVASPVTPKDASLDGSTDIKKIGLTNFGNTCYANSVIQALYFCGPFRDLLMQAPDQSVPADLLDIVADSSSALQPQQSATTVRRKAERQNSSSILPAIVQPSSSTAPPIPSNPPTLFSALRSLFIHIYRQPTDSGKVAPQAFIAKLKELNESFRPSIHQDAHEFLNYLLNRIVEELEEEKLIQKNKSASGDDLSHSVVTVSSKSTPGTNSNSGTLPEDATLVHTLFEGVLTSETRCLTCETVSSRDESFLDLSIDIEQNSSVSACLRQFSASEMLCQSNKFFCDSCCDLQEAEKRMKIKKLPNVLALHLKRFKYQEDVGKYIKLAYRVAFPFELRLFNTADEIDDADRLYELFGIVVHIGSGPHHGHYISIIKTNGSWFVFDDENVEPIKESEIPRYFGDSSSSSSAYVLYYQAVDMDLVRLGLRAPAAEADATEQMSSQSTDPSGVSAKSTPAMPPGLVVDDVDASAEILVPSVVPPPQTLLPPPISSIKKRSGEPLTLITTSPDPTEPTPVPSPAAKSSTSSKNIFKRTPSVTGKSAPVERKASIEKQHPITPSLASTGSQLNGVDVPMSPKTKDHLERKSSTPWLFKRKSGKEKAKSGTLPPDETPGPALPSLPPPPPLSSVHPSRKRPVTADNVDTLKRHLLASSNSSVALPLNSRPADGSESPIPVSTSSSSSSTHFTPASPPIPPTPLKTESLPSPKANTERFARRSPSASPLSPSSVKSPSHRKSLSRFIPGNSHNNHQAEVSSPKKASTRPNTPSSAAATEYNHASWQPPPPVPPPPSYNRLSQSSPKRRPKSAIPASSSDHHFESHLHPTSTFEDVLDISAENGQSFVSSTNTDQSSSHHDLANDRESFEPGYPSSTNITPDGATNGISPSTSIMGSSSALQPPPPAIKMKRAKRKLSLTAPMLGFGKRK